MKKVVIYGRLSKKRKGESKWGFDAQEWDFNNYLSSLGEEGVDYIIIGRFMEVRSARGNFRSRPEFMKALTLCRQDNAVLVVNKVDRLARDVESGAHILNNYRVVVTAHPDADRAFLHILLTIAQQESDNTAKRTKAALDAAKRKGVKLGSSNTKWQDANKDTLRRLNNGVRSDAVVHAETLRKEVEMMVSMKMSFDAMASKLKEINKKTPKDKWYTAGSVRNLCTYLNITGKSVSERYESLMA